MRSENRWSINRSAGTTAFSLNSAMSPLLVSLEEGGIAPAVARAEGGLQARLLAKAPRDEARCRSMLPAFTSKASPLPPPSLGDIALHMRECNQDHIARKLEAME